MIMRMPEWIVEGKATEMLYFVRLVGAIIILGRTMS
jgi:hypothetical protein